MAQDYDFYAVCESGQTLYYTITSDTEPYTVVVFSNGDIVGDLIIPESVTYNDITYSVTSIVQWAFSNSGLTSIIIPNSVESIGEYAFNGCSGLTSVTIGNSVTSIGNFAFQSCSGLTSVTIPNSVTSIGSYAFYGCSGLTSVTIGRGVTRIGESAFSGCSGLTTINFNATNCNSSAGSGFSSCTSLETLNIGENVTNIPEFTFFGCHGLTSITIPNSVMSIGDEAFYYCNGLATVNYTGDIAQWCGITFGYFPFERHDLYIGNNLVTDLVIPEIVTEIKDRAFYGATCLTSVTIQNSVTSIGEEAFSFCSGLTSVTIPNSVTSIGNNAFSGCSVTEPVYNASIFALFPYGYAAEYAIPEGILQIAGGAFSGCSELTSISIPESVTDIGDYAFSECSGLTSVIIPNSVTNIGVRAFANCYGLTSVIIGNSVTSIGDWAFTGNVSSLETIYSHAENPPVIEMGTFYYSTDINVFVPCDAIDNYASASYWSDFTNIYGSLTYMLDVECSNSQFGMAKIVQAPDCETGAAIIEAVAWEGYAFLSWNDGNTENPRTVEINSDTTFTATFAEARTVTVEVSDSAMGSVVGSGVYAEGAVIEITAIPNEGYRFDHWIDVENPTRDFNTDNPRTIVVSSDVSYIAVFEVITGIEESAISEIALFPNPATDILNITSSETISEIEIVNVMGQVVKRIEVNADNVVCDVEELKAGVYVVRIRTLSGVEGSATLSQRRFVKE